MDTFLVVKKKKQLKYEQIAPVDILPEILVTKC